MAKLKSTEFHGEVDFKGEVNMNGKKIKNFYLFVDFNGDNTFN